MQGDSFKGVAVGMRAFLFCLVFFAAKALPMGVTPFVHTFNPSKDPTIQYTLNNPGKTPMAFEVVVLGRQQGRDGQDILVSDPNSFTVFPPQVIVPAGGSRVVKLCWVGNPGFKQHPLKEQSFRVSFEQFPISTEKKAKKGASLDIKLKILASLHMTPEGAHAEFVIVSTKETVKDGKKCYVVLVKNKGAAHGSVDTIDQPVSVFGKTCPLKDVVSEGDRSSIILAESEREFVITPESMQPSKKAEKQASQKTEKK